MLASDDHVAEGGDGLAPETARPRLKTPFLRWARTVACTFAVLAASATAVTANAETPSPAAARSLLLDACRVGNIVLAVGERGAVVRSDDSGRSWSTVHSPTEATLTGINFADATTGWIVGHDATVLKSSDGGASWSPQNTGAPEDTSFLDVLAVDANTAITVGAFGACYITSDGGHAWTRRKLLEEELHLNRLTRGRGSDVLIAGERGTLLRLADVRADPVALSTSYDGSFNGVLAIGPSQLLAYGLRGHAFRSLDDGAHWEPIGNMPAALLSTGVILSSGPVVLAGQARVILVSHDTGSTFSPWPTSLTTAVARLLEAPDGSLLAFGEGGATRLPPPAPTAPAAKP